MTGTKPRKTLLLSIVVLVGGVAILVAMRRSGGSSEARPPAVAADNGRSSSNMCLIKPCASANCDACSNQNCAPPTDGCGLIDDPADRKLCEDLYRCFTDPKQACTNQGDAVRCWCGTNPTTCLTAGDGPNRGNGPCRDLVLAGGKSSDPETLRQRFLDPVFPLGRAVRLAACRGAFCSAECGVP